MRSKAMLLARAFEDAKSGFGCLDDAKEFGAQSQRYQPILHLLERVPLNPEGPPPKEQANIILAALMVSFEVGRRYESLHMTEGLAATVNGEKDAE